MTAPSFPVDVRNLKEGLADAEAAVATLQAPGTVRTITAATGALAATDAGGIVLVNRGTGVTLSVPEGVLTVGAKPIKVVQQGAGGVTVDPTGTVTLNGAGNNIVTSAAWTVVTLTPIGTNAALVQVDTIA